MTIPFTDLINSLPSSIPFTGPEALERQRGTRFKARLGANESAFGISPLAAQALKENIGVESCSWYGDPENFALRQLLATKHNVSIDCIIVDAGIDSLLGLCARAFLSPGTPVVSSLGAYPTFNYHVEGCGGSLHTVPYRDHHEDPEALLNASIEHKAKLVYLANPDNPMGTCQGAESIQALIDGLAENSVLLLDEAYVEFMNENKPLAINTDNTQLIRFRTFSKAYGLAGLRIGYAIAHPEIITGLNKIRNYFGVNKLAQIAAIESLQDSEFLPNVRQQVVTGRERIYQLAKKLDLAYLKSATNFVSVDIQSADKANSLIAQLNSDEVFLRKPMIAPQDQFIRIGVGNKAVHALLENSLIKAMNSL